LIRVDLEQGSSGENDGDEGETFIEPYQRNPIISRKIAFPSSFVVILLGTTSNVQMNTKYNAHPKKHTNITVVYAAITLFIIILLS
jgi:hypothetical protein